MLPFSKRHSAGSETELTDEDLIPVDDGLAGRAYRESARSIPHARSTSAPGLARPRRAASRFALPEGVEEGVAGQCLASIAAVLEESRGRPPPVRRRAELLAAPRSEAVVEARARLLSVGVRPVSGALPPPAPRAPPPFVVDAAANTRRSADPTPPPAFARRSTPPVAFPVELREVSSVAPVSLADREATVMVVRPRPRAAWILAAGVVGALCALGVTQLLPPVKTAAIAPEIRVASTVAPPPPPSPHAPAAPAPSGSVAAAPVILKFADDQGVAIATPAPAARPPAPSALPGVPTAPRASTHAAASGEMRPERVVTPLPASPPPPPPEAPKKRPLTPEQQLAEAQLKASMR